MTKDLTTGSPMKLILAFALPTLCGMLFQQFYNLVDTMIVGKLLGAQALAAVGSTGSINFFVIGFCMGVCNGFAIPVAQRMGAKEYSQMRRFVVNAAYLSALFALVLTVVTGLFCRNILVVMRTPADIIDNAYAYIFVIFMGIPATFLYNLLAAVFRGLGDSKSPLLFVLVACVVNIIGDLVLVAGFHLDAAGAAIATVAAQAVSVVCAVVILLKKKLPFTIRKSDFRLNLQSRKFLSIGLPLALQEFLTQLSFLALCAFVNRLGLEASSGYGVACKIVNFAMLIPSSLMQSMASFVSQNMGAGNPKRAKKAMFTGIGIGLAFGCAMFALVFFRGDLLSNVFTTDVAVIQNAFAYLKGFAPETLATAVLFSMVGYFNGSDKTVWVMVQGLVQTLLVRLPMAYIMSIQPNASLTMIGLAAPTSTVVGIVLNVCFFLALERRSKKAAV